MADKTESWKRRSSIRNTLEAYTFLLPFVIGVAVFFAFPVFISIKLAFGKLVSMNGFVIEWAGFQNVMDAFVVDAHFVPGLLDAIYQTLFDVPMIIVFSLILAIMLNKGIRFKGAFRVIMFIPFLLGSGYIMQVLKERGVTAAALSMENSALLPQSFIAYMGSAFQNTIDTFFSKIVSVLWRSGVQILIFLSGLQGIPTSLYEAAEIDGANQVEIMFKVTLPMIRPIMVLNIVFTIVSCFSDSSNWVLKYIQQLGFDYFWWERSAVCGWIYFGFVLLLTALALLITREKD